MDGHVLPAWDAWGFGQACATHNFGRLLELTSAAHMAAHSGVDLNTTEYGRATGLYLACANGHIKIVRYLTSSCMLAAGLDVNKGHTSGVAPIAAPDHPQREQVVRHLLESPDVAAAHIPLDVTARNELGETLLHWMCPSGAPMQLVELVLRRAPTSVDAVNADGKTALQLASAEKAASIRQVMRRMSHLYVLVVALWSRRERCFAAAAAAPSPAGGAGADPADAAPAGALDEDNEETRARRHLMGGMPAAVMAMVFDLVDGAGGRGAQDE